MGLVTSKEMILRAQKERYAVGAFNAENMEMVQAIVEAAEELRSPAIIQTTPSTVKYASVDLFYHNVLAATKNCTVPIAIHLDHGSSFELASQAFRAGYTSIMIDGSHFDLDGNIGVTKKVVEMCHASNIPVEGELGKVGGKEDDLDGGEGNYTSPTDAVRFVEETDVDYLAVAIGTSHGVYSTPPVVDLDRLSKINEKVSIPLVLHGGTGLSTEVLTESVKRGICKINFATELRIAFTKGVREVLDNDSEVIDVKKYCAVGRSTVKQLVKDKIMICGSNNKY